MNNDFIILITLLLVLCQLVVIFFLIKTMGNFLREIRSFRGLKIGGLGIGDPAPLFRTFDSLGNKVILKKLYEHNGAVLVFINSTCSTCKTLIPEFVKINKYYDINLVVINSSENESNNISQVMFSNVTYIQSLEIAKSYSINKVPQIYFINNEGAIVQEGMISNKDHLWNYFVTQKRNVS
jgi:methylamine dehydrogenase accessory protein MauD